MAPRKDGIQGGRAHRRQRNRDWPSVVFRQLQAHGVERRAAALRGGRLRRSGLAAALTSHQRQLRSLPGHLAQDNRASDDCGDSMYRGSATAGIFSCGALIAALAVHQRHLLSRPEHLVRREGL